MTELVLHRQSRIYDHVRIPLAGLDIMYVYFGTYIGNGGYDLSNGRVLRVHYKVLSVALSVNG